MNWSEQNDFRSEWSIAFEGAFINVVDYLVILSFQLSSFSFSQFARINGKHFVAK
jgi:hypothetical protein